MTLSVRILAVILTLLGAVACDSGGGLPPAPQPGSSTPVPAIGPPAHDVVGRPPSGTGPFTLDVTTGADTVRIVPAPSGAGSLYRVSTPAGASAFPTARLSGSQVAIGVSGGGSANLTLALNTGVAWNLRFAAGVGVIDVTLPAPRGTRKITEVAGASTLNVHLPRGTAVTVHAVAGAGLVALYGESHSGVAAGSTFSYGHGADRYIIDAIGGVSSLTVSS